LAEQPVKAAYLDGKIAVSISERIWDFETLREALGRRGGVDLTLLVLGERRNPAALLGGSQHRAAHGSVSAWR
jgi:hypothetical protein